MVNNILALQSEEWNMESVFDFSHKYVNGSVNSESRNTLQSVLRSALATFPAGFDATLTDATYMFYYCNKIKSIPLIDTSNCTDFLYMFAGCKALTSAPQLDTSKGTNFQCMFYECEALTSAPQLDTSKGTDFLYMFAGCKALTSVPQLDTSKGTSFNSMFAGCKALTSVPQLDTSKGTNFPEMFSDCTSLTTLGTDSVTDADGNTVAPWRFKASINFGYCPLDKASIECVMNNIQTVTTTRTLTISKTSALNICGQTDKSYDYTSDTHYQEMMKICTDKGWKVAVNSRY